jgi:hypothetical protein
MDEGLNKGLVAGTIIILVVLLGLPLLGQMAKQGDAAEAGEGGAPGEAAKPVELKPPLWTNANIVGTQWSYMMHTLTVMPGGIAQLRGPMYNVDGTWSIEGNKINISAQGKNITGTISGEEFLDDKGKPLPLKRVQ